MNHFIDWHEHAGSNIEKFHKTTLWLGEHVTVGLNFGSFPILTAAQLFDGWVLIFLSKANRSKNLSTTVAPSSMAADTMATHVSLVMSHRPQRRPGHLPI